MVEQDEGSSEFKIVQPDNDNDEKSPSHQVTINYDPLWKIYTNLIAKLSIEKLFKLPIVKKVLEYKPSVWGAVFGCSLGLLYGYNIISEHKEFGKFNYAGKTMKFTGNGWIFDPTILIKLVEYSNEQQYYSMHRLTTPIKYAAQGLLMGANYVFTIPAATVYYGGKWIFR